MSHVPRKTELEKEILNILTAGSLRAAKMAFTHDGIHTLQDYANTVSIKRLGMNDHGPVHMRISALNSLKMLDLLGEAGVATSLGSESGLSLDHSRTAVFLGAFLHDIGMAMGRDSHEEYSLLLAKPIIEGMLLEVFPESLKSRTAVLATALEGIAGHMATRRISSIEAGLVLVGDGCDMEHGRSRAPSRLFPGPQVGDIHQYSAAAVERVHIVPGSARPIRISITLRENAGFFQVENVLFPKINISPVKPYIELFAGLSDKAPLQYL